MNYGEDARIRTPTWISAGIVLLVCGLSVAVVLGFLWTPQAPLRFPTVVRTMQVPDEMQAVEMRVFGHVSDPQRPREDVEQRLSRYGWVEREQQRVHIPIQVAIELYVSEGGNWR